jgi:pilus assembly protein CpaB
MNTRRLILGLLAAFIVSGFCTLLLGRKIASRNAASVPKLRYVIAARPINAGEIVKAADLSFVDWSATQPVQGAFVKPEDAVGRSTVYPMYQGQILLDNYLAAPGAGLGLATKIPDGMRAIALKSDEIVGVAGFLFPGSRVDVLVTYRPTQNPDMVTSTVLQNAQIVAVGHQMQPDPDGKAIPGDVVTILANPEDAERVVLANTQGTIHFVLRNGSDQAAEPRKPAQLSQLGPPVADKAPVRGTAEGAPKPKPYVVETIMGDKATSASF